MSAAVRQAFRDHSPKSTRAAILEPEFRTPPHNLTMEQAVLAALLTISDSWIEVSEHVLESDFYSPRHAVIFKAVAQLAAANQPYDTMIVLDWLQRQNRLEDAGGEEYLGQLMEHTPPSFGNLASYAYKLRELSVLRALVNTGHAMTQLGYTPGEQSAAEVLDQLESQVYGISERFHQRGSQTGPQAIPFVLRSVVQRIETLQHLNSHITGLSTGFVELDNKTSGMQAGDLIIVAARPSMGKTTFAMNLVESIIFKERKPALVFSMEMPADSITVRLISSFGGIDQTRLRSGRLEDGDWVRLTSTISQLQDTCLYIDDSSALSPNELRSRARRMAKQCGGQLGVIMVDYLQLMRVPGSEGNRVNEISEISRSLKALAKEMKCPVIALSQLNRSLEQRPNKRPMMSDLRESGAIEQDADLIMFIYRDEVYTKENCKEPGVAEIIIGKQRNGPIGTVRLAFQGQFTRFGNLAPGYCQNEE